MRRFVYTAVLALMILAGGGAYAITNPHRVLGVGGDTIGSSVAEGVGAPGDGRCTRQEDRAWWLCTVEDDPGSGSSRSFYVTADDEGCWEAREYQLKVVRWTNPKHVRPTLLRVTPGEAVASGCASFWDYGPHSSLFGGISEPAQLPLPGSSVSEKLCTSAAEALPPPPTPKECGGDPLSVPGGVLVDEGEAQGHAWRLVAYRSGEKTCLRLSIQELVSARCYGQSIYRQPGRVGFIAAAPVVAVIASANANGAKIFLRSGDVRKVPLRPQGSGLPRRLRIGVIVQSLEEAQTIVSYDAQGRELDDLAHPTGRR